LREGQAYAVLQQFAQRIAQRLRRHDRLGRYGGEEFLVLLPGTDRPGACAVAEELRRVIEERPFTFGSARIPVTVSVGVCARGRTDAGSAGAPAPQAQVERMIADADRALYAAKRNGRNRVEVAD
jgi:diguanylate cyclase (GGDEF)-like protein